MAMLCGAAQYVNVDSKGGQHYESISDTGTQKLNVEYVDESSKQRAGYQRINEQT